MVAETAKTPATTTPAANLPLAAPLDPSQVLSRRIRRAETADASDLRLRSRRQAFCNRAGGLVAYVYGFETKGGTTRFALDPMALIVS